MEEPTAAAPPDPPAPEEAEADAAAKEPQPHDRPPAQDERPPSTRDDAAAEPDDAVAATDAPMPDAEAEATAPAEAEERPPTHESGADGAPPTDATTPGDSTEPSGPGAVDGEGSGGAEKEGEETGSAAAKDEKGADGPDAATATVISRWPDAAPTPGLDRCVVTISAGNTHLHWACHNVVVTPLTPPRRRTGPGPELPDTPSSATETAADGELDIRPAYLWRTPHVTSPAATSDGDDAGAAAGGGGGGDDDDGGEDAESAPFTASGPLSLSKFLAPTLNAYVFGDTGDGVTAREPTHDNAVAACAARRPTVPPSPMTADSPAEETPEEQKPGADAGREDEGKVRVYVVSTNPEQTDAVRSLWSCVPSTVTVLSGEEFFSVEDGRYETMGVDRLATLHGASDLSGGSPVMVVDAGTALTYSAVDDRGKVMGGGISPGLGMRFKSLKDYTGQLPWIDPDTVRERVMGSIHSAAINGDKKDEASGGQLPVFAKSTEDAIMGAVLSEVARNIRGVIDSWLDTVTGGHARPGKKSRIGQHKKPRINAGKLHVFFTGGDGEVVKAVCGSGAANALEGLSSTPDDRIPVKDNQLIYHKNLIHYGMRAVLMKRAGEKMNPTQGQQPRLAEAGMNLVEYETFVAQRVAKDFDVADTEGNSIFRGTVASVEKDADGVFLFSIEYDDGDKEDAEMDELNEMLTLYHKVGEKPESKKSRRKREASEQAQSKKRSGGRAGSTGRGTSRRRSETDDEEQPAKKRRSGGNKKISKIIEMPGEYNGRRVAKYFDDEVYFGTVTDYMSDTEAECGFYWHIDYDDGDREDYDLSEVMEGLKLYGKKKGQDPNKPSPSAESEEMMVDALASMDDGASSAAGSRKGENDDGDKEKEGGTEPKPLSQPGEVTEDKQSGGTTDEKNSGVTPMEEDAPAASSSADGTDEPPPAIVQTTTPAVAEASTVDNGNAESTEATGEKAPPLDTAEEIEPSEEVVAEQQQEVTADAPETQPVP